MNHYLVITGASRGIGKSTAQLFYEHGWKVINISRNPSTVPGVKNILFDLAQPGWQEIYIERLQELLQQADKICLVHNAAAHDHDEILDLSAPRFREILEINVVAPLLLNQSCLPYMRSGSSIIYIGSTLSEKAVKGTFSYTTSKHASVGMMRATCQDLVGTGIHTACVCPGFTETEMLRQHLHHDPAIMESIKSMVSAHRFIEPEEIAKVIWFCANNPVINGAVLHANLGQIER